MHQPDSNPIATSCQRRNGLAVKAGSWWCLGVLLLAISPARPAAGGVTDLPGDLWDDVRHLPTRENAWWLAGGAATALLVSTFEDPEAVARTLNQPVIDELAEIHMYSELPQDRRAVDVLGEKALGGIWERFVQTQKWDSYPYTETSADFRRRVGWAVESAIVDHPGETIVIACHGGVINAYLAEVLGLVPDMFFRPYHASSHRMLFGQGRRVIETLNEDSYLAAEGLLTH